MASSPKETLRRVLNDALKLAEGAGRGGRRLRFFILDALDEVDGAFATGWETGPESSREEMDPELNGTLDARCTRVAPAPHLVQNALRQIKEHP